MKSCFNKCIAARKAAASIIVASVFCFATAPFSSAFADVQSGSQQPGAGAEFLLSSHQTVVKFNSQGGGLVAASSGGTSVPEPATWAIFGMGMALIGFGVRARRSRSASSDR